jgi:hypothetical protein
VCHRAGDWNMPLGRGVRGCRRQRHHHHHRACRRHETPAASRHVPFAGEPFWSPLRLPTRHRGKRGGLPGCSRTLVPVPMPYTPAAPTVLAMADGPVLPSTTMNVSAAATLDFSGLAHIGPRTPCLRLHAPVSRDVARLGPGGVASHSPVGIRTPWVRPTSFGETWTRLPSPRHCISWSLPCSLLPPSYDRTGSTCSEARPTSLIL